MDNQKQERSPMVEMSPSERMKLGAELALTQTIVMGAFKGTLDLNRSEQIEDLASKFADTLVMADESHRYQIIDGTESCISLLSHRYKSLAKDDAQRMQAKRTEFALELAIQKAIDRLAAHGAPYAEDSFSPH